MSESARSHGKPDKRLHNATDSAELPPAQVAAMAVLLAGGTVTAAADAAGVHRTTVHTWLRDDAGFIAAYNRGRREVLDGMYARLLRVADKAVATVEQAVEGDPKTAVALLRGLGLLSGSPGGIGPTDAAEVAAELQERDAELRTRRAEARAAAAEAERDEQFEDLIGSRRYRPAAK
jgi:hypothetical protein